MCAAHKTQRWQEVKICDTYMLVVIFAEGVAARPFDPGRVGAVDVRQDVVVGFIQPGVSQSLQQNHVMDVVFLLLLSCHHLSFASIFPGV